VTLDEIEEMIRGGREVSVVDAVSGDDLTGITLTQIILEHERTHRATLPAGFLHQLIKHGETWQDFLQRSMRSSLEGIVSSQRDAEKILKDWAARAGWGPPTSRPEPRREPGETETDRLRDEVTALRDRLRALEERLEKRKGDVK
jgi:polyhydroxyalkanoate synthesis repressor PhaR